MLAGSGGGSLVPIITPIITLLVLRALLSSSRRAPVPDARGTVQLRYGRGIVAIGVAMLLMTMVLGAVATIARPKSAGEAAIVVTLMAAFGGGGMLFLLSGVRTRLDLTDGGLRFTGMWGGIRELAWNEVATVSYSPALGYLTVRGHGGKKISVSPMMTGFVALLDLLESRLGSAIIGEATAKARAHLSRMSAAA